MLVGESWDPEVPPAPTPPHIPRHRVREPNCVTPGLPSWNIHVTPWLKCVDNFLHPHLAYTYTQCIPRFFSFPCVSPQNHMTIGQGCRTRSRFDCRSTDDRLETIAGLEGVRTVHIIHLWFVLQKALRNETFCNGCVSQISCCRSIVYPIAYLAETRYPLTEARVGQRFVGPRLSAC